MTNRPQMSRSETATILLDRITTATTIADLNAILGDVQKSRDKLTCVEVYDIEVRISARRKEILARRMV